MFRTISMLLTLATLAVAADAPGPSLVYTCDLRGRLWPMPSEESKYVGDLGGVARLGSFVADWRAERQGILLVDVGNACVDERVDGHTIQALGKIGYDALNCGETEATLPLDRLAALARGSKTPFISANLVRKAGGKALFPRYVTVERDGWKVHVIGLVRADVAPKRLGAGLAVQPAADALRSCLTELGDTPTRIVVLACMPPEAIYSLARRFPRVNVFLGGPAPATSAPGESTGNTLIAYRGDEGRTVGRLDALVPSPRLPVASSRVELLSKKVRSDENLAALAEACRKALGGRPHPSGAVDMKMPATSMFVGSEVCRICHIKYFYEWQKTGHAGAWRTLMQADPPQHTNPACLPCHATGYRMPGGFDPAKLPADPHALPEDEKDMAKRIERKSQQALKGVGCEACHGGNRRHLGVALKNKAFVKNTPQLRTRSAIRTCHRCHVSGRPCLPKGQEDKFDLPRALQKIRHWEDEKDTIREF